LEDAIRNILSEYGLLVKEGEGKDQRDDLKETMFYRGVYFLSMVIAGVAFYGPYPLLPYVPYSCQSGLLSDAYSPKWGLMTLYSPKIIGAVNLISFVPSILMANNSLPITALGILSST